MLSRSRSLATLAILTFALCAARPALAQKTWSGFGDGTSWADGGNWVGGTAPISTDLVLLDNSMVPGSYSVLLPGGAVTTAIVRLTIMPAGGQSITLTLPPANTGVPGFQVGDETAATDDIILRNGAVLRNRSGAASGNGIETNTFANGTVRIENGARYLHSTARSTGGVVPRLSTAAGTELGVFEYDSPGTGSVPIGASGRTYGSLTLTRTAGAATYTSSGGSPLTVRGDFTVNPGVTYTSSMTAAMNLGRHWTNNGVVNVSNLIAFDGTLGPQSISGSGMTVAGGGWTIAAPANVTIESGAAVAVGGVATNNGMLTVAGTFQINEGGSASGNALFYSPSGTLALNTATNQFVVNEGDPSWPPGGSPANVTVRGAGITINAVRTVNIIEVFAPIGGAGSLTVAGTCRMHGGGSFLIVPVWLAGATLVYDGSSFSVGSEWSGGMVVGPGVPENVTIQAGVGNTVTMQSANRFLPGNLTIASGTLALNPTSGDLHLGGNFVAAANLAAPLVTNDRVLILDGTLGADNIITIDAPGGLDLDHLRLVDAQVHIVAGPDDRPRTPPRPNSRRWPYGSGLVLSPPDGGESIRMETANKLYLNGSTLRFEGSASMFAVANGTQTIEGPGSIEVNAPLAVVDAGGAGRLSVNPGQVHSLHAPTDFGPGLTTLNGSTLTLKPGGSIANNHPPIYTGGATLVYDTGGAIGRGAEWSATSGPGFPDNVTVASGTTLNLAPCSPQLSIICAGDLTIEAGGSLTANAPGNQTECPLTIRGNVDCGGPCAQSAVAGADWFVEGNLTISAPFTQNGRALVLSGNANRTVNRQPATHGGFDHLRVATTDGALTALGTDVRIEQSLELAGGDIDANGHTVIIAPGAAVSRTSGSIRGNLQKHIDAPMSALASGAAPPGPSLTFEVGDANGYTPVDLSYANVAGPGNLTVSTTGGEHPDAGSSGVDPARDVNRYWTMSLNRAPDPSESFVTTFHWLPGEKDAGSDYETFDVFRKSPAWSHHAASFRGPDRTTAPGFMGYGDFLVGTPILTGVEPPATPPPATYLRAVTPNPFRSETSVTFGLREAGRVRLAIYNVRGGLVRTLLDGEQSSGPNVTIWDGRDDQGHAVSSGRYIARLEAGSRRLVTPLTLLR